MAFSTPYDNSSPPSTPDKSRSVMTDISTTPGGLPPSSAPSFTPKGPPPSTVFGSSFAASRSRLNFAESAFGQSGNFEGNNSFLNSSFAPSTNFGHSQTTNGESPGRDVSRNKRSLASFTSSFAEDSYYDEEEEQEGEEDYEDEEDSDSQMEVENESRFSNRDHHGQVPQRRGLFDTSMSQPLNFAQQNPIYTNPQNAKRAKIDENWARQEPSEIRIAPQTKSSVIPSIAKNLAAKANTAEVHEPSSLILDTEDLLCRIYDQAREASYNEIDFSAVLSAGLQDLVSLWQAFSDKQSSRKPAPSDTIGPAESSHGVVKASFLATLLLQLHHPPPLRASESTPHRPGHQSAPLRSLVLANSAQTLVSTPRVLLDWLNQNHAPLSDHVRALLSQQPNPTASPDFWEIIQSLTLRGGFAEAVQLLHSADFQYARSAMEDGFTNPGYRGAQLQNIQKSINQAIHVLQSCPGIHQDDWDIKGMDWAMYRKKVSAAINSLEDLAEGQGREPEVEEDRFQASHFGMSGVSDKIASSFTKSSRMAESRVPWTIYQNLKSMYNIILGNTSAILRHSSDWVEATIGLTVWWDGDDDDEISRKSLSGSHGPLRQSQSQAPRSVDFNPEEAYLRRLDYAFGCVTDSLAEDAFQINPMNSIEVGLASIFEGNVEGVLELLQTWSLSIASAAAEIASLGGWLDTSTGAKPMPGFNKNDLMVLSYGQQEERIQKDDILIEYSTGLLNRPALESPAGLRDGWEVALEILSRLDDRDVMKKKVNEMLTQIPLVTSEQMDKVVLLCTELGFDEEGRKVSERYGDSVVENSEKYGMALICYARAHSSKKVKNVLDLLISFSLVHSRAYPSTSDLDEELRSLIHDPKTCLSAIASVDPEAAGMLQFYFSGYATLRRFYDIRDEELYLEQDRKPKYRPLARKRAAAEALATVISSAADSIYGGLYDPERDSAVQVDGLLALLGEALVFVDHSTALLTPSQQFTILSAVEDLETVTSRVYEQCEECFQATVLQYKQHHSSSATTSPDGSFLFPPSPRALLKKSVSSLTASSGFSLIGSEMLESQGKSVGDSGVLVSKHGKAGTDAQRGWDWRAGLPSNKEVRGADVIRVLRLGLAKGLSFGVLA